MTNTELRDLRKATGLSQPEFTAKYLAPHGYSSVSTLRGWEQGHRNIHARAEKILKDIKPKNTK